MKTRLHHGEEVALALGAFAELEEAFDEDGDGLWV